MPRRRVRDHYEQLSEFERGRIIGLKEGGWTNRRINRHMGRSDVAIRRCWQECVDSGRFKRHDSSGPLTAHRYVDALLRTVLVPLLLQYPGLIFQQDNAKSHTTRVVINCLTAYKTLSWPARLPDPSPNEHVWDMMRRQLHLPGNVDGLQI
ncbi:uncharacterized protein TNCV_2828471 [Trichonephila clavipes]|nr:uncharacterized protein TNCV_2828471 [Trichonephila clavipes]